MKDSENGPDDELDEVREQQNLLKAAYGDLTVEIRAIDLSTLLGAWFALARSRELFEIIPSRVVCEEMIPAVERGCAALDKVSESIPPEMFAAMGRVTERAVDAIYSAEQKESGGKQEPN